MTVCYHCGRENISGLELEILKLLRRTTCVPPFSAYEVRTMFEGRSYKVVAQALLRLYNKDVLWRKKEGAQWLYGAITD